MRFQGHFWCGCSCLGSFSRGGFISVLSGIQMGTLCLCSFTAEDFVLLYFQGNVGLTTHNQNWCCKEMGLLKELGARPWTAFGIVCERFDVHLLCHSDVDLKESQ